MAAAEQLITANLDIWSSAIKAKSAAGRGKSNKLELYGIKKLRELILELAVRGLLVPQDPNDKPASELLKKIAAKKAQLIKEGKIKKQNALTQIEEGEESFDLPEGWGFARFGQVLDFSGGGQPPKSTFSDEKLDGYVQLVQIRDLGPRPQPVYVPKDTVSKFCTPEDVMIGRYGASVGKVFWGKDGAYNVALIRLHNDYGSYIPRFLFLLMKSPLGQSLFSGISRSAQAGFRKGDIEGKLLPVLSGEEQNRIVAKVDELMALCDKLEQQQETSITAHQTLVQTLLGALTTASERDGFTAAWARIADHFDSLFTTEWNIDQLKQTILQLAVMGKLVPQDPNDEPANELLKKITAEKAKLVKDGKIKKQKALSPIEEDEKQIELPEGWYWARLTDVYDVRDGTHDTPKYHEEGYPLVTSKNLYRGKLDLSSVKYISADDHKKICERSKVDNLDILFAMIGSIGNPVLIDTDVEFSIKNVALFKYYSGDLSCPEFLLRYLLYAEVLFREQASGAVQSFVSLGKIRSFPIALPPLDEQRRIVAKVDELMALCDTLKTYVNANQTTQLQLADAMTNKAIV